MISESRHYICVRGTPQVRISIYYEVSSSYREHNLSLSKSNTYYSDLVTQSESLLILKIVSPASK